MNSNHSKQDPDGSLESRADRHRKLLIFLTLAGVLLPLLLAALRFLGYF